MSKAEIQQLLASQIAALNGKRLTQLPQDLQITYCQRNKKIGELAYQIYNEIKDDPAEALEAAHYLSLAIDYYEPKAWELMSLKSSTSNLAVNIDAIQLLQDPEEIFRHGICYLFGIGHCSRNHLIAFQLFETSVKKGSIRAINYLSYMYRSGLGVAQSDVEALKWTRVSAEQGNAIGQEQLGHAYRYGWGVSKDHREAVKWLYLAAEQGNAQALLTLGYQYQHGKGVIQNDDEAFKFYRLAAEQGVAQGQFNLGTMYEFGVASDYAMAFKWYRLAAKQGETAAKNNLALLYRKGRGVTRDYVKALKWFRLAAECGNSSAQYNIGYMYEQGLGVAKNLQVAIRWYRLSLEQTKIKASPDEIIKNDSLFSQYHAAMLINDQEAVIKLLIQEESAADELAWDIQRSIKDKNSVLIDALLNIIEQLEKRGVKLDRHANAVNDLYTQKALLDHEKKIHSNEFYNEQELDSLYDILAHINFSQCETEIAPLINLLIDTWYAAINLNIDKFTGKIADYLPQLIYKLSSQNKPALDEYAVRQCSLVLIKQHFGKQYEVSFDLFELDDLLSLLTCIKCKKSVSEINQFIGKNIIQELNFSDDAIKNVVTSLANYFKQNKKKVSTSPYLAGLNKCLTELDDSLNNKQKIRRIMLSLLTFTSEYKLVNHHGTTFPLIPGETEKDIYRYLKGRELDALVSKLNSQKNIQIKPAASPAV